MNNKVIKILQIFIIYLIGVSSVQAKPLLSPYPKAKLDNSVTLAGEETQLMTKFDPNAEKSKQFEFTKLIGDTAHYAYEIKNVASLKVTKNYENALQDAGFNVIYRCSLSECNSGKYNNRSMYYL